MLTIAPITVNSATAAAMLDIGESTFLEHVSRGTMPKPRKVGARSVWLVEELREAALGLPINDDRPTPKPRKAA